MATEWDTRVGAYGVIVKDGAVLLAHWNEGGKTGWTLPGGGLEFGEDAPTAAVREILRRPATQRIWMVCSEWTATMFLCSSGCP